MLSLSDHIAHKTYKTAADRGITCLFAEATVKNFFRKALISRVFDHLWNARLIQTWDRSLKWVWDYRNRGEFSSPQKATAAGAWNSRIEMYYWYVGWKFIEVAVFLENKFWIPIFFIQLIFFFFHVWNFPLSEFFLWPLEFDVRCFRLIFSDLLLKLLLPVESLRLQQLYQFLKSV